MTLPHEARSEEDMAWKRLAGREGAAEPLSSVYRLRLSGPTPGGLAAHPRSFRPVDLVRGAQLLSGVWKFGAARLVAPPDHAPWGPAGFPSLHFADCIHRFDWLPDLAATGAEGQSRARALTVAWTDAFGRLDPFAWRLAPTAARVINLLCAGPWLLDGLGPDARESVLEALARQVRHLHLSGPEDPDPAIRFRCAVAVTLSGPAMEDGGRRLETGMAQLQAACSAVILGDGGHASRSPETLANALLDLQAIDDILLRTGHPTPSFLTSLQARMAVMLDFLTLPNGDLLPAHGGGAAPGLSAAARRSHGEATARFVFSQKTGFQRIQAGGLSIHLDAGAAPDAAFGGGAHSSALALWISDGGLPLVTACGAHACLDPLRREAARQTAAHANLAIEGIDSAAFLTHPASGRLCPDGPAGLAVKRLEEDDQFLLECQHGGWRPANGLIHRRRLFVSKVGASIRGEDALARPANEISQPTGLVRFDLRFHLHPDVDVRPGGDTQSVVLTLPNGEASWRFRCETSVKIEESRYWAVPSAPGNRQMVISGTADPLADGSAPPNRVRWAFSRLG